MYNSNLVAEKVSLRMVRCPVLYMSLLILTRTVICLLSINLSNGFPNSQAQRYSEWIAMALMAETTLGLKAFQCITHIRNTVIICKLFLDKANTMKELYDL